jgi:hypothetical protein
MPNLTNSIRPRVGASDVLRAYVGHNQVGQKYTNLVPNPKPISSWTPNYNGGTGSITYLTGSGRQFLPTEFARVTWATAASSLGGGVSATATASLPNGVYFISMYVRTSVAQTLKLANLGTAVGTISTPNVTTTAGAWSRMVGTFTVTTPGTIQLFAGAVTGGHIWAVGETLDAQAALISAGSTAIAYFDGVNFTKIHRNICLNPRAATALTSWTFTGTNIFTERNNITPPLRGCTTAAKIIRTASGSGAEIEVRSAAQLNPGGLVSATIGVAVGESCSVGLFLKFWTAAGVQVGSRIDISATTVTDSAVLSVSGYTVPATAASVSVGVRQIDTKGIEFVMSASGALIVLESTAPADFFDGSTPDSGSNNYEWEGAAGLSVSYVYDSDTWTKPYWFGTADNSVSKMWTTPLA